MPEAARAVGRWLLAAMALTGWAAPSVERIPLDPPHLVVVKSARLPNWTGPAALAHHAWFELKRGGEDRWERLEVLAHAAFVSQNVVVQRAVSAAQARDGERWSHPVHVLAVLEGEAARRCADRLIAAAEVPLRGPAAGGLASGKPDRGTPGASGARTEGYPDAAHYRAWPGPNSNSFVARLLRDDPDLSAELPHNAMGKDYAPCIYAGPSTTGTGVQLDTFPLGVQLGLEEGVELHLLQGTWGLDLWPPALKVPLLPRLGWP